MARPAGPAFAAAVDGDGELVEPILVVGQRERRLHVGRDLHGDVGTRERELHLQRKPLADTEVFGRHAEIRELPAAARRRVVPNDVRIVDLDGADAEVEIGGRAAALCGRRIAGRRAPPPRSCQLLAPLRLRARFSSSPCEPRLADLDAPREQRQQGEAQGRAADARHRLVAEARRVAQAGGADRDADRRKHRELQVAVERELPARGVLHGRRDVVLVVVRVEQQADRNGHDDEQQHDDADCNAENLE